MSDILLPSIDNKIFLNKNKVLNKLKGNQFNSGMNSIRSNIIGNYNDNFFRQNSINKLKKNISVNFKKHINTKLKGNYTNIHLKLFLKNKTLDLEEKKHINKKLDLFLINNSYNKINSMNISMNNSYSNKNNNNAYFNFLDEFNSIENNNEYTTTDYNNFSNINY